MVVIVHQTVSVAEPVKALSDSEKGSEKQFAVGIIPKNRLPLIPPRSEVVQRSVVFDP